MITDAVLWVLASLLTLVTAPLPTSSLDLPSATGIGSWIGTNAGPVDAYLPVVEIATGLMLIVTVWLPAAATYLLLIWAYRAIPVVGGR